MTSTTLLRVEALNFERNISDTSDLQTTRGASQLASALPEAVLQALHNDLALQGIEVAQLGSSAGIFALPHPLARAQDIQQALRKWLQQHLQFKHLVVAIEVEPLHQANDYPRAEAALLSRARHAQMAQLPTVAWSDLPAAQSDAPSGTVCAIDRLRPARQRTHKGGQSVWVSDSVHARREYGHQRTLKLLRDFAKNSAHPNAFDLVQPPKDLETLAAPPGDREPNNSDHKIAVIYVDGNQFGRFRGQSLAESRQFDDKLRLQRQQQLVQLAQQFIENDGNSGANPSLLRMELLFSAGDEFMLVLPARLGPRFVQAFFESTKTDAWTLPHNGKPEPLTHALGMVIAHDSSPLSELQSLCFGLVDLAKKTKPLEDSIAWLLLESFDAAGLDAEICIQKQIGQSEAKDWVLSPAYFQELVSMVQKCQSDSAEVITSRRRLYRQIWRDTGRLTASISPAEIRDQTSSQEQTPNLLSAMHQVSLWDFV